MLQFLSMTKDILFCKESIYYWLYHEAEVSFDNQNLPVSNINALTSSH